MSLEIAAQEYQIKKIGLKKGISSNYITGITQDRFGYMWFSTESGLNRFDSNVFKVYKKDDINSTQSISGNELNVVYADQFENKIWIATQRDGLDCYNYEVDQFEHYKHNKGDSTSLPTNDITNIINAKDGNLWITTYHKGFAYFDKKTKAFISENTKTLPGLVSNRIWSVAQDVNGDLYLGHDTVGLSIYNPNTNKIVNFRNDPNDPNSLPGNKVTVIFEDQNANIWIGTNNGLALFYKQEGIFKVFRHNVANNQSLIADYIFSIAQTQDKKLWIGTENGGISVLDLNKQLFTNPKNIAFKNIYPGDAPSGLSDKTIRNIYVDSFQNVWIGTYGGGVNYISHQESFFKLNTYSTNKNIQNSLSAKTAWGICKDNTGKLWVGTDGGGIDVFKQNIKIKNLNTTNSLLTDDAVISAFKDSRDDLWFGTFKGGVNIVKKHSDEIQPFSYVINSDVRCFDEDASGNIWIGASIGVFVYNPVSSKIKKYTSSNSELKNGLVRCIKHDQKGNVWIGYFGDGIYVFDKNMHLIKHFDTYSNKDLPSNMINSIYCDKTGNVWIGSGEGLLCFDNGNLDRFMVCNGDNGISSTHISAITEDVKGNIWFSTQEGLCSFNIVDSVFYNYKHENYQNIPLGKFMEGSVVYGENDTLYFGSQDGLCFFDPSRFPSHLNFPEVSISDIKIYENNADLLYEESLKSISTSSPIVLTYEHNTFKISFNVLDYALKDLTDCYYRLAGVEDRWHFAGKNPEVTFGNIPYGSYVFQIKSSIRNQAGSEVINSWKIKINPPFWLSWWAKVLYFIFIVVAMYLIAIFYKRRVGMMNVMKMEKREYIKDQELHEERLVFFTNIAHELRTPVTLILGPVEDLIASNKIDKNELKKLNYIKKSSQHLLNLINQLMEFRKTESENRKLHVRKGEIDILVEEVALKYCELNTNDQIKINLNIKDGDYVLLFDAEVITIVLDNLISNAIKYTREGFVNIGLNRVDKDGKSFVEIVIKDTGIGIHKDVLPSVFDRYFQEKRVSKVAGTGIGLALVKKLTDLHDAEITVESVPDEGTVFTVLLDVDHTYPEAIHPVVQQTIIVENELMVDQESEDEEVHSNRKIILIVEDHRDINEYIANSLSGDFKTISAFNGKEGLEQAFESIPDIIISDIMMPEMDGFELTKQLKNDIRTSHIPIVLLSAKDTIADKTKGYQLGIDSYLTKPFSAELLQSRVNNILENRKKLSQNINESSDKAGIMNDSLSNLDKEFLEKVSGFIEDNIDSADLEVKSIADYMAMSHSSLYRKVKALTDLTVNEYIRSIRIKKSEEYLLSGRYSISEITYMVGMSSANYFRKCFKDIYNKTPSEYVKDLAGKS